MSFDSFYGGRMGASFIIVKKFNDISIEEGSEYAFKYYACTADGSTFLSKNNALIEKASENYRTYRWKPLILDGSTLTTKDVDSSVEVNITLDTVYAEGMVQCFSQGGDSTDEVNYGEYVIIDTLNKNNPNNGKVYRRGMNYIYSATDNPLAGAEYIGQIVGPQGNSPELSIDHYDTIIQGSEDFVNVQAFIYDESNLDIIPGFENGNYNDTIELVSANIQDEYGNIYGCVIGFKLPYLINDFSAGSVNPYDPNYRRGTSGNYYYEDLITEDKSVDGKGQPLYFNEQTGKWVHPFYHKWQLKIPSGIHGANSTHFEIVHTQTMPKGYESDDFAGTPIFNSEDENDPVVINGEPVILIESVDILKELEKDEDGQDVIYTPNDPLIYNADNNYEWCKILWSGTEKYVKKRNCYMDVIRYKETYFEDYEEGRIHYKYIGTFASIQRITLADDGTLIVYYTGDETPQIFNEAITWIEGAELTQQGDFTILFNNHHLDNPEGPIYNKKYTTNLQWIDLIEFNEDGTIDFYANNNHDNPLYTSLAKVKWIRDLEIQTKSTESSIEGTGDQKLHITYNTIQGYDPETEEPIYDSEIIGEPINYIIESIISHPNQTYPDVPESHLLVYYADPVYRQTRSSDWVTYTSKKYADTEWTEWVDLGPVSYDGCGIRFIKKVSSLTELQDSEGNWIPPERLANSSGDYIRPDGAGWCVSYVPIGATQAEVYSYNYENKTWENIGLINIEGGDADNIIVKSSPIEGTTIPDPSDVNKLHEKGFWFAQEIMKYAN